jgi:hypothetical protein
MLREGRRTSGMIALESGRSPIVSSDRGPMRSE